MTTPFAPKYPDRVRFPRSFVRLEAVSSATAEGCQSSSDLRLMFETDYY